MSVDSRILSLEFNNKEFQRAVEETLNSLKVLDETLNKVNRSGSLRGLSDSVNNIGIDEISSGIDAIKNRFSTFGIVGMTIIQRLTNAGINFVSKMGAGLNTVTNQIKEGGYRRAANLEQANFLLEGLGANVTQVMEDVNYAVDGTAYGLDEAAKAAASFFASGVMSGDQMKTSLRAVSGAAAMTGAEYASIADIFTTVAGQGKLMTMQLREFEGRGLNVAAVLSKDAQFIGKTEADIRDMVTKGQISFDQFALAMDNAFGQHAKDANKTFSGSLSNMKTALSRLGEAFISPAMKAAIPVFNAIRESINEVTAVFKSEGGTVARFTKQISAVSEAITDFITKSKELDVFKRVGISLTHVYNAVVAIFKQIGKAFKEAFPEAGLMTIYGLSKSMVEATINFRKFIEQSQIAYKVFRVIFGLFKIVKTVFKQAFAVMSDGLSVISPLISNALDRLSELNVKFGETAKKINIFEKIASVIRGVGDVIHTVFETAINLVGKFVKVIADSLGNTTNLMAVITGAGLLNGIASGKRMFDSFSYTIEWFFKSFSDGVSTFKSSILGFPATLKSGVFELTNYLKNMTVEVQAKTLMEIAAAVLALAYAMKIISDLNIEQVTQGFAAVSSLMVEMAIVLKTLTSSLSGVKGSLGQSSMFTSASLLIVSLALSLVIMAKAIKAFGSMDMETLAKGLGGMTITLGAMVGAVIAISKWGKKVKLRTALAIIAIAEAIKIISQSVSTLGSLDPYSLAKGLGSIVVLLGAIMGFSAGTKALNSKTGLKTALAVIAIAGAIKIISASVATLGSMNIEELAKGLGSIVILMGAMFGLSAGISAFGGKGMVAAGAGMILIAKAISILTPSLKELGSLDLITLGKGLGVIAVGLIAMAAASNLVSLAGAASILIMSVALSSLATTIGRLGGKDIKTLAKGLGAIAATLGLFVAASLLLAPVTPIMLAVSGALFLFSTSLALLGVSLILIGSGLTALSGGLLSFAATSQSTLAVFVQLIKEAVTAIVVGIAEGIPQIIEYVVEGFVTLLSSIAEAGPEIAKSVTSIIGTILQTIADNVPIIVQTALFVVQSIIESLAEHIDEFVTAGITMIAGVLEGIAAGIPLLIQAGYDILLAFINGLAEGIRENAEPLRRAVENLCIAILDAFKIFFGINSPSTVMKEQGGFLVAGLKNGITSHIGEVVDAFIGKIKDLPGKIVEKAKSFKASGQQLVDKIKAGIGEKAGDLWTNLKTGLESAKEKASKFKDKFKTAGSNLLDGIKNGLRDPSALSKLLSAAGETASSALEKFKKKLGIKSPSRAFAEASKWIPIGAAEGIKKYASVFTDSAEQMGSEGVNAMSSAINDASLYFDENADMNPTISPVVDLSNVARGSSEIDALMSRIQALEVDANINRNLNSTESITDSIISGVKTAIDNILPGGSDANKTIEITVPVNLDGREIARTTAVYIEPEINKLQARSNRALGIV